MKQLLFLILVSMFVFKAYSDESSIVDLSKFEIRDVVKAEILQDIPFRTDVLGITFLELSAEVYDPEDYVRGLSEREGCHIQKVRGQEKYNPENYEEFGNRITLKKGTKLTSTTGQVIVLAKFWGRDYQSLIMHFYTENSPHKDTGIRDFDFTLVCKHDFGIEAQGSTINAKEIDLNSVNKYLEPYIKLSLSN